MERQEQQAILGEYWLIPKAHVANLDDALAWTCDRIAAQQEHWREMARVAP